MDQPPGWAGLDVAAVEAEIGKNQWRRSWLSQRLAVRTWAGGTGQVESCARPMGIMSLEIPVATQPTPHSVNRSSMLPAVTVVSCPVLRIAGGFATRLDEIEPRADRQAARETERLV
ncbi:uncharacterized protein B0T23DRAFT_407255 [Neurospora hispaniola]|uniref:Uncharacterized protein n=1 Tax=Neurospora hispaniola TaxID=588809 RepID=A0AAJ0I2U1_9PEZI|nr:hypothetical protein B0T23DRAFT_407255 [Neurospora hispaniola]